jgi:hypothetical protein
MQGTKLRLVSIFNLPDGESKFIDSLMTIYALSIPFVLALSWFSGYYGESISETISYLTLDGHCDLSNTGFGDHCFGDFVQPVNDAKNGLYFVANSAPANLLYRLIAFVLGDHHDSQIAMLGNIMLSVIALSIPAILSSLRSKTPLYKCLLLCGPFTYPALIVLDRGNNFGFSIPFVFAFSIFYLQGNDQKAILALIIASFFKPQLLVLLVIYLISRKAWRFIQGVRLGLALHLAASWIIEPDLILGLKTYISQLNAYGTYINVNDNSVPNLSISKSLRDLVELLPFAVGDNTIGQIVRYPTQIGLFIFCLIAILLWRNYRRITKLEQLTILLPLSVMFPGVVFPYYLAIVLVVIAIHIVNVGEPDLFFSDSLRRIRRQKYADFSFLIALTLSICPFVLPGSSTDGRQLTTFSLITLAWINFLASKLIVIEARKLPSQT